MAGIAVPPVEGRWDAAAWDGDPSETTSSLGITRVGVWDGDPGAYLVLGTQSQWFSRSPSGQRFVRQP